MLLLLYAGVFLHCQPLPGPAASVANTPDTQQEQSGSGLCKKKLQTVQADPVTTKALAAKHHPLPLGAGVATEYAALYFGLLFPADQPAVNPARGPDAGPAQGFANHPNKAPPVRFS
ncbi:hypothetical protein BEN48_08685 [Hymenobacter glacialis]|uniref:Uncharacterized protein n=1 Tax=Hymenobacter glacialis TaxID=1908236 RepID=A0A1G1TCT2_9BACT|nr:hypothetical protein BEN48_08685 [Hymenobacter glacialis]